MIIKQILEQLESSAHPVAKALHKGAHFKVLVIGFKKGMILKEHQTKLPTVLTVLNGQVLYKIGTDSTILSIYDEVLIPIEQIHSVEALEDSLCLLTQG